MANETKPDSAESPAYEPQRTPSPVMRGLSQALMQGAFAKFGAAFTDTGDVRRDAESRESRLAPFMQAGNNVADALQTRWQTMEYENFQNEYVEPWREEKQRLHEEYRNRNSQMDEGVVQSPDGKTEELDLNTKEGRLKAVRMRGQLESRYYQINGDLDLDLFGKASKWENNPQIMKRIEMIRDTTANMLAQEANPEGTMQKEEGMSVMRGRENAAEAAMVTAKSQAANTKRDYLPRNYQEALQHPDVGVNGIIQWMFTDETGLKTLHEGGAAFINTERQLALEGIMADNPGLDETDPKIQGLLTGMQSEYLANATVKYLKWVDPKTAEMAKQATPWFFKGADEAVPVGVVGQRMGPKERKTKLNTWNTRAEEHFDKYMADPENDPSIAAAMKDLNEWLKAAVYGKTEEPGLREIAAEKNKGTERYVGEVLEQVPEHINRWWAAEGGSGIGAEENPAAAKLAKERAATSVHGYGLDIAGGRAAGKKARIIRRSEGAEKRKKAGITAGLKRRGLL